MSVPESIEHSVLSHYGNDGYEFVRSWTFELGCRGAGATCEILSTLTHSENLRELLIQPGPI